MKRLARKKRVRERDRDTHTLNGWILLKVSTMRCLQRLYAALTGSQDAGEAQGLGPNWRCTSYSATERHTVSSGCKPFASPTRLSASQREKEEHLVTKQSMDVSLLGHRAVERRE